MPMEEWVKSLSPQNNLGVSGVSVPKNAVCVCADAAPG